MIFSALQLISGLKIPYHTTTPSLLCEKQQQKNSKSVKKQYLYQRTERRGESDYQDDVRQNPAGSPFGCSSMVWCAALVCIKYMTMKNVNTKIFLKHWDNKQRERGRGVTCNKSLQLIWTQDHVAAPATPESPAPTFRSTTRMQSFKNCFQFC